MKVNIYYGGRGLIEDSTIFAINKITEVLKELRVDVVRYNLYEQKNSIAMLANTLKDADAVVLAASVEWYGAGGLMYSFLDACWLYGDKNKIKKLYMFPVVISGTRGERRTLEGLAEAWEILGGIVCEGFCAYVENHVSFETNPTYIAIIEKKAEEIYRIVSHKQQMLPSSTNACLKPVAPSGIEMTPQESEQLSVYVSDDSFVKKQKQDVEQLSQMYKNILDQGKAESGQEYIRAFKGSFSAPEEGFSAIYAIKMTDKGRTLVLEVANGKLSCNYGDCPKADLVATTTSDVIENIVHGKATLQGAFMSGSVSCKGDFVIIRTFDRIFRF